MDGKTPFFSVIMPVYNAENTMHKAIGSILTQTFGDYELIIVENGSSDKSLTIARGYEAAFPNVRALHSEPRGVSRARNTGLRSAKGRYIVFIDADDSYVSTALEAMHDALTRCDPDVLICGMTNYFMLADGALCAADPGLLYLMLLDPYMYNKAFFEALKAPPSSFALRSQCSRAYRRGFLEKEGILFDERCGDYEDMLFNMQVYSHCSAPFLLYRQLYRYNHRAESSRIRSGNRSIADNAEAFRLIARRLDAASRDERGALIFTLYNLIFYMIRMYACEPSAAAFDLLFKLLKTPCAKIVIAEMRTEKTCVKNAFSKQSDRLLSLLREGNLKDAIELFTA